MEPKSIAGLPVVVDESAPPSEVHFVQPPDVQRVRQPDGRVSEVEVKPGRVLGRITGLA